MRNRPLLFLTAAAAALALLTPYPTTCEQVPVPPEAHPDLAPADTDLPPPGLEQPAKAAGLGGAPPGPGLYAGRVFKDPATGRLRGRPPEAARPVLPPAVVQALSRSPRGLRQRPGATPAGGVRLDLEGRFRSPLVAVKAADGSIRIECLSSLPAASEPPAASVPPTNREGDDDD